MAAPVLAEKRCTRCGETKPLTEFYRYRRSSDGRDSRCAVCRRKAVDASAVRRRAAMGEDAWREHQRQITARSRERRGPERDRLQKAAYDAAFAKLRERHREEFDALYAAERHERGLT